MNWSQPKVERAVRVTVITFAGGKHNLEKMCAGNLQGTTGQPLSLFDSLSLIKKDLTNEWLSPFFVQPFITEKEDDTVLNLHHVAIRR